MEITIYATDNGIKSFTKTIILFKFSECQNGMLMQMAFNTIMMCVGENANWARMKHEKMKRKKKQPNTTVNDDDQFNGMNKWCWPFANEYRQCQ